MRNIPFLANKNKNGCFQVVSFSNHSKNLCFVPIGSTLKFDFSQTVVVNNVALKKEQIYQNCICKTLLSRLNELYEWKKNFFFGYDRFYQFMVGNSFVPGNQIQSRFPFGASLIVMWSCLSETITSRKYGTLKI